MFMLPQSPSFSPRDNSSGRYDVILDSAAAECIIRDKELLANIRSAETAFEVVGIAPGHPSIKLDTVGDLFGLGTVFYSPTVFFIFSYSPIYFYSIFYRPRMSCR